MKKDNSNELFADSLALEAQVLEDIFTQEKHNLHNSASLLGKPWYAVGLESVDSDTDKDNANKQGIVRRMIGAILNFIKRIIEKVKAFFSKTSKEQMKANQDFIKGYKGPTDEQLIATLNRMAKEEQPAMESLDGGSIGLASLEEAMKSFKHITGKAITEETLLSAFQQEKLKIIRRLLGEYRISLLIAMLEENFYHSYDKATRNVEEVVSRGFSESRLTTYLSQITEASEFVNRCKELVDDKDDENDDVRTKTLMMWIVRGDSSVVPRMNSYFESAKVFEHTSSFLEKLKVYVEDLQDDDSKDVTDKLETAQKALSNLTSYIALAGNVITTNELLVIGMQRVH